MKKFILVLAAASIGCAYSARTIGMQDPTVEVVRAMTQSQTAIIKSLTDALASAQSKACSADLR